MKDQSQTKQVLIQELAILRQRVEELEQSESEWKKEKEELKKSESLFRSYFDLPLYGIAITSPEKGWIRVNDRICSIMGYSRDEIVCKTWSEMTHPDDIAADAEQFSRVLSGKIDQYNMCKRFIRKDGEVIWTNLSVGCGRNSDSSVDHIVAMIEDITSVKLAEEALRQERMLYEDLVTTEPAGVYRLRVKLRGNWQAEPWNSIVKSMYSVDMASDRYCNILGISYEEFMTNAGLVRDLIHPDDKQDFDEINMEAMTRLSPFTWEGRIIRDQQTRWIHFESLPRELDSETVLWTGIVYDITDRKQAVEALRESEERLRLANKATNDVVWDWDVIHDTQQWNESGKVVFGWADIVERPQSAHWWVERVHPEDLQRVSNGFFAVTNNPQADYWQDEYRFKKADGSYAQVMDRGHVLRDKQGKALRMIGAMLDITDRKRAEEEKRALEERLQRSEKMEAIGTLAGGIAHDFNNILAAIIGYTELAMGGKQKENHQQYLQQALKGAERAKNLVKQILTFSRQDISEKKPLDIKPLLKEAVKFLRSSIPSTIEIQQKLTDDSCNIMADPTQMHQVIMNLCTNASHAMKKTGGIIKIELSTVEFAEVEISRHPGLKPGPYVQMTISDTGQGIDPVNIQRIFDPFFTTKTKDEGTGLGLSVVYGIVKSHDGIIDVYSEPDKGAVFNVYLPRIILTETREVDRDKPVAGGNERILFVDDEPALVDLGIHILSSLGYEVTGVMSSVEALDLFSTAPQRFDLVITDMTLPKMTGIVLSRKILKIRPDIPIVLCSGIREEDTEEDVQTLGIKSYLIKPLTRKELARVVRKTLDDQNKSVS